MFELLKLALTRWKKYLLGTIVLFVVDILQIVLPMIVGRTVDRISTLSITLKELFLTFLLILSIGIAIVILRFLWRWFIVKPAREIERELRRRIYEHILKLDLDYLTNRNIGDIMAKATNDVEAVRMALSFGIIAIYDAMFYTPFALGAMFFISVKLTLATLIPLTFIIPTSLFFGRRIHRMFRNVQNIFGEMSEFSRDVIQGIHVVKAFNMQEKLSRKFVGINDNYLKANVLLAKVWGMYFPLISIFSGLAIAVLLVLGGFWSITNEITIGQFVAFLTYLNMLVWPMMGIGWGINLFQRGKASYDRIVELLETKPKVIYAGGYTSEVLGNIRFKNVHFRILKDISFEVEPGWKLGIVGKVGSGKSTLLKLILRIYDPEKGNIYLDGKDLKEWNVETLRRSIAYVPQESYMFSMSIRENLMLGNPDASEEELVEACKLADVWKDIEKLPDGLDTLVGERGVNLSGGQKQRLAIARAILMKPKILILDDAFSSVDVETESNILENIRKIHGNITIILASHKILTVMDSNLIIVLDEGGIVEMGKHKELLAKEGLYQSMYALQVALEEKV